MTRRERQTVREKEKERKSARERERDGERGAGEKSHTLCACVAVRCLAAVKAGVSRNRTAFVLSRLGPDRGWPRHQCGSLADRGRERQREAERGRERGARTGV